MGAGDGASVPARSAGIQLPTCRNPGAGAAWGACTEVQVQDGAEPGERLYTEHCSVCALHSVSVI